MKGFRASLQPGLVILIYYNLKTTSKSRNKPYGRSVKESKNEMKSPQFLTLNHDLKNFLAFALKALRLDSQRMPNDS